MFLRRHLLSILAVAAALASLVWFTVAPKTVEVDTGLVRRGPMEVTVDEDGITRYRDIYKITAPLAGELQRIGWRSGDPVQQGQLLATLLPVPSTLLDPRSRQESEARVKAAEAALQQAEARIQRATGELEQARRYLERDERRFQEGLVAEPVLADTRQAFRVATTTNEEAVAAREMARFELRAAEAALLSGSGTNGQAGFPVHSPVAGLVIAVPEESRRVLAPGETILEIGDPKSLEVRADILSQDAVRVRPGQPVRIEQWGGDGVIPGRVLRVEPSAFTKVSALGVDEQRVWVTITVDPGKEVGLLGNGYRVEVRIIVWENEGALLADAGAVFRSGRGWAAYRVDAAGRAEHVALELGKRTPAMVEVLHGLSPGDRLILHPGDRVSPGARLRLRNRDGAG
ncbi:MAG: HlyD family efflux transporter periplasmic adaptor subunit [Verrucomicrobia bacterium]|nr:HlyD family efflux transporter periplasmic adaptor subunit [Verrucomicrobiota bacterium]